MKVSHVLVQKKIKLKKMPVWPEQTPGSDEARLQFIVRQFFTVGLMVYFTFNSNYVIGFSCVKVKRSESPHAAVVLFTLQIKKNS